MCMMPGRGKQSGIIWGGGIYERTERQIRDFSESVRDRQLFRGGRGIKLHTVRYQPDDGRTGGRTGGPVICQSKKGGHTYRQRSQTAPLYPGNGKPEGEAAPGGV